jgi:AcrR family transcriptional regulator
MSYDTGHSQPVERARDAGGQRRPLGPRERVVRSAAQLIREQGVSSTGMRDIVVQADAPRGSLQHYFPGGKDQLVAEALLLMGGVAGRLTWRASERDDVSSPSELFARIVSGWRDLFVAEGFGAGCPLVAAAADVAAHHDELRAVIARAFRDWEDPLAKALEATGVDGDRSHRLAVLLISALEGAIVLARVRRDVEPLDIIVEELRPTLDAANASLPPNIG